MENNLFKSGVLLFALGSMSCISLWAQGTVEDYNRAYALREKYNAKHVLYAGVVPHWVDQTSAFWYVRQTEKGKEYVKVDAASKKRTALFDQQKMASALTEKAGREINAYNLPLQNCRLNISLDTLRFQLDGKFWAYSIKNNRLLDEGAIPSRGKERHWMEVDDEKEGSPVTSPDGKWTAFIKNDNVYVREVATGKEKQLSQDGTLSNYYSSYIQWSPDSKSVVSCRIRPVEKRYVYYVESSPADQAQPKLHKQEYAKPGDELRFKVPCIFEVESGRRLIPSTELFSHQYELSGPMWNADSKAITFEYNERGHKVYRVLEMSAVDGSVRTLIEEKEGKILKKSLAFTDRIDLASSQNNIIIEFASSDYINRHVQQIFEYKLEGFDKTWISTTVPFARYTNLSPGNYTLCVRMADGDAQDMAVLNICISLPWYNTWYAWVLYIIIFITIVWMIIRYRKEKNDLFLSLEKERFEKQHIEELNHEKLVFFTNVSHEFRTPLTLIISHIESLLQMPNLQPMVYNRVLKLKRSAQYMNNLISELLDFRKFTQNKYTLNMSQKDICLFMKEIFYVFSDYAHSKGLKYEFFSNQEVILCWFDSKQLEKVFLNLLSNAFKYTERGSIEIKICVEGENVAISIHDTGKGIAMGDFNRIFDRFYQIEGSSESATSPGTGIGLALTKSIVEKHHGEICLDSQLGKGSVFTVKLPLGDARYIHDEHVHFADREKESDLKETDEDSRVGICAVANEESFQSEEGESKKYTVLVVEDNDELIQVLCELFSPFYQVIMASNGKEGLDKAYEYKPDLIIS